MFVLITAGEKTSGPFVGPYTCRTLRLPEGTVEIRCYSNPQIRLEFVFTLPSDLVFDGLLYANYRPKHFGHLSSPFDSQKIKLPKKAKRKYTNKSIVGHKELRSSIQQPRLFNAMFQ